MGQRRQTSGPGVPSTKWRPTKAHVQTPGAWGERENPSAKLHYESFASRNFEPLADHDQIVPERLQCLQHVSKPVSAITTIITSKRYAA